MLTLPGLVDSFTDKGLSRNLIATCESINNSYTPTAHIKKNIPGQRIDYILYHPGSRMQVEIKKYGQPLPDRVPNHSYSYSDHEAVESILVISKRKHPSYPLQFEEKKVVLEDCVNILSKALSRLVIHKIFYTLFAVILFALLTLSFAFNSPFGYLIIFNILRMFVVILIIFCIIMATIWNKIENHAVLAGKLAIEVNLRQLSQEL